MKKDFLSHLAPPGTRAKRELFWIIAGICVSALISLTFVYRYHKNYQECAWLYSMGRTAAMPLFSELLGNAFFGFTVMLILMAALVFLHYASLNGISKSIYVMKRLPQRSAVIRYVCGMPVLGAALIIACAAAILLIYWLIYRFATPLAWLA